MYFLGIVLIIVVLDLFQMNCLICPDSLFEKKDLIHLCKFAVVFITDSPL